MENKVLRKDILGIFFESDVEVIELEKELTSRCDSFQDIFEFKEKVQFAATDLAMKYVINKKNNVNWDAFIFTIGKQEYRTKLMEKSGTIVSILDVDEYNKRIELIIKIDIYVRDGGMDIFINDKMKRMTEADIMNTARYIEQNLL